MQRRSVSFRAWAERRSSQLLVSTEAARFGSAYCRFPCGGEVVCGVEVVVVLCGLSDPSGASPIQLQRWCRFLAMRNW